MSSPGRDTIAPCRLWPQHADARDSASEHAAAFEDRQIGCPLPIPDGTTYQDLGGNHVERGSADQQKNSLVKRLANLDYAVEPKPLAARTALVITSRSLWRAPIRVVPAAHETILKCVCGAWVRLVSSLKLAKKVGGPGVLFSGNTE